MSSSSPPPPAADASDAEPEPPPNPPRSIPASVALVPVLCLVVLLFGTIVVLPRIYPDFSGSGHLPLVFGAAIAGMVAVGYGHRFSDLEDGVVSAIRMATSAMLILLVIGMLMGTWMAGGIVPALIHWGLMLLRPGYFLPTACAVCSVVSLVSGSSWSTAGTVGLALIGIGGAMGIDPGMTAGAVVSGAYFGDKLSPMSDTTNLAPAMAGAGLFEHIRHMVLTTGPSWVIAMILYSILSLGMAPAASSSEVASIGGQITAIFEPSVLHLLAPAAVVGLILLRVPALPVLLLGVVLGGLTGIVLEGISLADVLDAAMNGYHSHTGDATVDELLSRGGMLSMSSTVLLILSAMSFGGVMERSGMLATLAAVVLRLARSTGSLIAATVLTALGINVIAADQYLAIVVPGRMYAAAYAKRGLHPKNLSRALEDGGTITSPLIPWNTCGAFMAGTLMVSTASYLPYAFLNILNPILGIAYGFLGWTIVRLPAAPASAEPGAASASAPSSSR